MRLVRSGLLAAAVAYVTYQALVIATDSLWGVTLHDSSIFIESGRLAVAGLNPYDVLNSNGPISVVLFSLLAGADPYQARPAWHLASLAAYLLTVALLVRSHPEPRPAWLPMWAVVASPLWSTLANGQIYTFLALIAASGWLLLRRGQPVFAGVCIGLIVAVKPQFVLWPAALFLAGHRRVSIVAGLSAAAYTAVGIVLFGPSILGQWIASAGGNIENNRAILGNFSLPAVAYRAGAPELGIVASAFLLALVALWAWKTRPGHESVAGMALPAAILASPVAWPGYCLVALPLFLSRPWSRSILAAAILLAIPDATTMPYLPGWVSALRPVIGVATCALMMADSWSGHGHHALNRNATLGLAGSGSASPLTRNPSKQDTGVGG